MVVEVNEKVNPEKTQFIQETQEWLIITEFSA